MTMDATENLSIGILGPGAVGGFLASRLVSQNNKVICLGKKSLISTIKKYGIKVKSQSFGDVTVHPQCQEELSQSLDLLLVTCKADQLTNAIEKVPPRFLKSALILPLINGFDHLSFLRKKFPEVQVLSGMIGRLEAKRIKDHVILHTTKGAQILVSVDSMNILQHWTLESIKNKINRSFDSTGIDLKWCSSEAEVMFGKLTRLSVLAGATAASGKTIGEILDSPSWRKDIIQALEEATTIANSFGVPQDKQTIINFFQQLPHDLSTSLARDVQKKHRGELDHILGAMLRFGKQKNLPTSKLSEFNETIKQNCLESQP